MQERRATDPLMLGRRCIRPQLAGRQGHAARLGAGCLPLAPSGHVGADAHSIPAADRAGSAP
jgi:hypothetical protein